MIPSMPFFAPTEKKDVSELPKWDTVAHSLCTLPVSDGNFKSAMGRADEGDIREAIAYLKEHPENNQSRLLACQRELRRRGA